MHRPAALGPRGPARPSDHRTSRWMCWPSRSSPRLADEDWDEDELFQLVRRAYPYRDLQRDEFDQVIQMLAQGFSTRRGRRGALVHHDTVNSGSRPPRRPDAGDHLRWCDPRQRRLPGGARAGGHFRRHVNEDFAVESMPGDIFQLGNTSWRIFKSSRAWCGSRTRTVSRRASPSGWARPRPAAMSCRSSSGAREEIGKRVRIGGSNRWVTTFSTPPHPECLARDRLGLAAAHQTRRISRRVQATPRGASDSANPHRRAVLR